MAYKRVLNLTVYNIQVGFYIYIMRGLYFFDRNLSKGRPLSKAHVCPVSAIYVFGSGYFLQSFAVFYP